MLPRWERLVLMGLGLVSLCFAMWLSQLGWGDPWPRRLFMGAFIIGGQGVLLAALDFGQALWRRRGKR